MAMMARRLARTVLAAHLCTSARAWETIAGLKTQRMTVTPAPEGSPIITKGDTITVHATGIVKCVPASIVTLRPLDRRVDGLE